MAASKTRRAKTRSTKRPSKRRDKAAEARARTTQAAQQQAEKKTMTLSAYRRRRATGWTLVVLGVVIGIQHLLHHMGFFTLVSPGVDDLIAGYPLAGLLGIGGAILLSKT